MADRLFGAAERAIEGGAHLVSALAAKRHLLLHTLFLLRGFRQPKMHLFEEMGMQLVSVAKLGLRA
jgi:hypothetical protein